MPDLEDQRSLAVGTSLRFGRLKAYRATGTVFFGMSDTVEDLGVSVRFGRAF